MDRHGKALANEGYSVRDPLLAMFKGNAGVLVLTTQPGPAHTALHAVEYAAFIRRDQLRAGLGHKGIVSPLLCERMRKHPGAASDCSDLCVSEFELSEFEQRCLNARRRTPARFLSDLRTPLCIARRDSSAAGVSCDYEDIVPVQCICGRQLASAAGSDGEFSAEVQTEEYCHIRNEARR
ncbi:MAG: hypothetical protein JNN30_14665 [Rhodanobacteraceae bacterium]|nr:hypothetical protein [Rhodanobacteraceae bacterium]